MRLKQKIINISRWDFYSLSILFLALAIQAMRWKLLPIFVDIYYHLLTAVGFNEAGGWVHSCFWEYAPIGRPQLYPPLLHIILLSLIKAGIPILVIGKLTQLAIYPLLLFTIWYAVREIFDNRLAFFTLFLLFSIYSFYLVSVNTLAASLSLVFCFLSLLFQKRKKIVTASILLAIAFYTHGFTPWLFVGIFVLYGLFYRNELMPSLKICLLALLLASPIIIYQFSWHKFYYFEKNIGENLFIEVNILHWAILLFGLLNCLARKNKYYIFVSLFLLSFVFLFTGFIFRYFSFYGIMSLVFLNAVFLSSFYDKLNKKYKNIYLVGIFVLFFISGPTLSIDLSKKDIKNNSYVFMGADKGQSIRKSFLNLNILDSSFSNFIFFRYDSVRANEISIYFPKFFSETVDAIIKHSSDRDIFYTNLPYTGGILSLLSHRATSTAMLSEVKPYKPFDEIAVSRLIIWQKDPDEMQTEPVYLIEKYHLDKIADTKLAFIYENTKCNFKKETQSATISYKSLFILIFLSFLALVCSVKFGIDK